MSALVSFVLPEGYTDRAGRTHREGAFRLATARDEMLALSDFRVHLRPEWFLPAIFGRIAVRLGGIERPSAGVFERLGEADRAELERAYREAHGYAPHG